MTDPTDTDPPPPAGPSWRPSRGLLAFLLAMLFATVIIAVTQHQAKDDEDDIPLPPPGYEFCVQNEQLSYCPQVAR